MSESQNGKAKSKVDEESKREILIQPLIHEKLFEDKWVEAVVLFFSMVGPAVAHNIGLHNRILRLENQGQPRRADKNQRAGRESEKERKRVHQMGNRSTSEQEPAVSGLSERHPVANKRNPERPASRIIAEVDHERVIKELVGGPSRNGKGAVPPLERAGSENSRAGAQDFGAGKGSSGVSGLAERIGRCFEEVYEVARVRGKRVWRGMGR